jgi:hypothetical protein
LENNFKQLSHRIELFLENCLAKQLYQQLYVWLREENEDESYEKLLFFSFVCLHSFVRAKKKGSYTYEAILKKVFDKKKVHNSS